MSGTSDLLIAFCITMTCCGLSLWRSQDVAKDLFFSSVRMALQIALLGFALKWIFAHPSLLMTLLLSVFMTVNAAIHSQSRLKHKYPKLILDSMFATVIAIWPLAYVGSLLLHVDPWWKPDLFLPLIGMLLGNVLNGISLGMDNFTHELNIQKDEVLSVIALGATTDEATNSFFKRSLKVALTPMINAMSSMGLVSIPGMMTGQILGGQAPEEAAIIQIIMMLLIAAGVYFGAMSGLMLARRRLFDERGLPCF